MRATPRRRVVWIIAAVLCAVIAVFAYQVARTALALQRAHGDAKQVSSQLKAGDLHAARETVRDLAQQGKVAHGHSRGLLWRAASAVPLIGDDVRAIRVVSRVLDEMSPAYPDALKAYSTVTDQQLRSDDGRIDVRRVSALAPTLGPLAKRLTHADHELAEIVPGDLVGPLRRAMVKVQDQVDLASSLARGGATASRVIAPMLGADGPRTYLLVAQNNAELRATGGLFGSFSLITATNGLVQMGGHKSQEDFAGLSKPALPLTKGESALYGETLATDQRDANITPDFPRSAELLTAMLPASFGRQVDGVIAIDPVTLNALLGATGPLRVGSETFTKGSALQQLLYGVYERFPLTKDQDQYFAASATGIFNSLLTGKFDQQGVVGVLAEAASQRRLLIWSRHSAEEKQLAGTASGGALPRDTGTTPQIGIYLDDSTGSKLDYFLDFTTNLASKSCAPDGTQTVRAGIDLHSSVPADTSGLPSRVVGPWGLVPKGWMRMSLRVYAPTGGKVVSISADGRKAPVVGAEHDGRDVAVVSVLIKPQERVHITATLRTGAGQRGDPVMQWTPGMQWKPTGSTAPSACG